jgi:peptidoglycan LD-endopeptidase LytH
MQTRMIKKILIFIIPLIIFAGCSKIEDLFTTNSPHDNYYKMLEKTGLSETALGSRWIAASTETLNDSLFVNLPFSERGYFYSDEAKAASFRFKGYRGEQLIVELVPDSSIKIFLDLFRVEDEIKRIAFAPENDFKIEYTVEKDGEYIVRLQPELLKETLYSFTISKQPSLVFPVEGKDSRAVQSFWGDPRDGGKRSHQGVDIFASKGTPVLSASDGIVTRTGTNRLGGKVVWVSNLKKSFYYAHLDSQLVAAGTRVKKGEVIGLVGNTGNARTTPPHLHFGIYYSGEGAVNPLPYIKDVYPENKPVKADKYIGSKGKINTSRSKLFSEPGRRETKSLDKGTPVKVYGGTDNFYRIALNNGKTGFIPSSAFGG